ncbi:DgyrCDS8966 [Dimorphilus gyrociliatus]|uniref:Protoheme IX farnesyltransferase, mitochondrial n=1 Tax=Dimorphilus gyrociliatus TaxID=2664684 RepID=A0A7I8W0W5_9ANNE|nr:DgyrCDS8966 [Dimorphilus gyrociliatus]
MFSKLSSCRSQFTLLLRSSCCIKNGLVHSTVGHSKLMHKTAKEAKLDNVDENLTIFVKASGKSLALPRPKNSTENYSLTVGEKVLKINNREIPAEDTQVQSVGDLLWRQVGDYKISELPKYYMALSKLRLTGLVVATAMAGYALAPEVFCVSTFAYCSIGTALTSAAANSINQFLEVPYDSQMSRTKNRVLVRGYLSPLHAVNFAIVSGVTGLTILALGTNLLTTSLGLLNLILYTAVYTPMKRKSPANTWVGSIVGAIPPIMGWTACGGGLEPGAFLLGALLFSWQFPHFNALSWNLKQEYSRAGYRMMSVVDPDMCRRVALRHSVLITIYCLMASPLELTNWSFAVDSFILNMCLVYLSAKFYKDADSKSARKLFRFSLIHIPALFVLMLISKKWKRTEDKNTNTNTPKTAFQQIIEN